MPIPPLYVVEVEDNVLELIDGLQRISTWLHFRGHHPLRKDDQGQLSMLRLEDCDIVKELNGLTWDDLATALKIRLKRHFVRVEVIRQESDPRLRYYMFKRLNTGGETLSNQEIRNCTVRLLDPTFNEFINKLSTVPAFEACVKYISPEKVEEMYKQELVLRFFALKNDRASYEHRVDEFLTHFMERVADPDKPLPFNYEKELSTFEMTFETLAALGETPFSGTNTRFSVTMFEALTIGIQPHLDRLHPKKDTAAPEMQDRIRDLKANPDFVKVTVGGGLNYAHPLRKRIEFVEKSFESVA
jgi:hypothetical protein